MYKKEEWTQPRASREGEGLERKWACRRLGKGVREWPGDTEKSASRQGCSQRQRPLWKHPASLEQWEGPQGQSTASDEDQGDQAGLLHFLHGTDGERRFRLLRKLVLMLHEVEVHCRVLSRGKPFDKTFCFVLHCVLFCFVLFQFLRQGLGMDSIWPWSHHLEQTGFKLMVILLCLSLLRGGIMTSSLIGSHLLHVEERLVNRGHGSRD